MDSSHRNNNNHPSLLSVYDHGSVDRSEDEGTTAAAAAGVFPVTAVPNSSFNHELTAVEASAFNGTVHNTQERQPGVSQAATVATSANNPVVGPHSTSASALVGTLQTANSSSSQQIMNLLQGLTNEGQQPPSSPQASLLYNSVGWPPTTHQGIILSQPQSSRNNSSTNISSGDHHPSLTNASNPQQGRGALDLWGNLQTTTQQYYQSNASIPGLSNPPTLTGMNQAQTGNQVSYPGAPQNNALQTLQLMQQLMAANAAFNNSNGGTNRFSAAFPQGNFSTTFPNTSNLGSFLTPGMMQVQQMPMIAPQAAMMPQIFPGGASMIELTGDNPFEENGRKEIQFPLKLLKILSDPEYSECICWSPNGRSWRILKPTMFEQVVIPFHFRHAKYASFMRQVNGWGFKRILSGKDNNAYYHEDFLRDYPYRCLKMKRIRKQKRKKLVVAPDHRGTEAEEDKKVEAVQHKGLREDFKNQNPLTSDFGQISQSNQENMDDARAVEITDMYAVPPVPFGRTSEHTASPYLDSTEETETINPSNAIRADGHFEQAGAISSLVSNRDNSSRAGVTDLQSIDTNTFQKLQEALTAASGTVGENSFPGPTLVTEQFRGPNGALLAAQLQAASQATFANSEIVSTSGAEFRPSYTRPAPTNPAETNTTGSIDGSCFNENSMEDGTYSSSDSEVDDDVTSYV